eukprot:TRINITY_DN32_c0_g1_i16.p1 TRINITY_DN32_c0_g1~~TRINITY_DN32_c0_g1_i16.p1  ORF type:complete len:100 (+),score=17.92 TRINITY_DN32_c0_g1_i16:421-720(+)
MLVGNRLIGDCLFLAWGKDRFQLLLELLVGSLEEGNLFRVLLLFDGTAFTFSLFNGFALGFEILHLSYSSPSCVSKITLSIESSRLSCKIVDSRMGVWK